MEKKNLKLSELIEVMREISSEGNHFVKGDTFIDVVTIARQSEEIEACEDIEAEFKTGTWYWSLRKNGSQLDCLFSSRADKFAIEYAKEAVVAYKIDYANLRFSISLYKKYGNEFFD